MSALGNSIAEKGHGATAETKGGQKVGQERRDMSGEILKESDEIIEEEQALLERNEQHGAAVRAHGNGSLGTGSLGRTILVQDIVVSLVGSLIGT